MEKSLDMLTVTLLTAAAFKTNVFPAATYGGSKKHKRDRIKKMIILLHYTESPDPIFFFFFKKM